MTSVSLLEPCEKGDIERVKGLIKTGFSLNAEDAVGEQRGRVLEGVTG